MRAELDIEKAAREAIASVLEPGPDPADLDLDADMSEGLGLTSLNKVIFLMSVCDDTSVSLSAFTETDLAAMRTLRDVVGALTNAKEGHELG
jgi:acyl carrier protein